MNLEIELDTETDGRCIACIPDIPGVVVYGATMREAKAKVKALALRVIAERMEYAEDVSGVSSIIFVDGHICNVDQNIKTHGIKTRRLMKG